MTEYKTSNSRKPITKCGSSSSCDSSCESASTQRKASDTAVEGNGFNNPTSGISIQKKGAQDEAKRSLKEMELKRRCLEVEEEKERMVGKLYEEIQVLKEMFANQMGEIQKEKERIVGKNSEEIQVLKEMFTKKMGEMQKDLLAMVEHCLNFENVLSQTKEENQKMRSQIKELVQERDRRMQQDQLLGKDVAFEEAAHIKESTVEEVANIKTPGVNSNKCSIVTVSSGSLGSTPSLSKSPPSALEIPPSPKSTKGKIKWHHPTSAPVYPLGPPRPSVYNQSFAQYIPPVVPQLGTQRTVPGQYQYDTPFYPYGPYSILPCRPRE